MQVRASAGHRPISRFGKNLRDGSKARYGIGALRWNHRLATARHQHACLGCMCVKRRVVLCWLVKNPNLCLQVIRFSMLR
jgi:hypothetical protein